MLLGSLIVQARLCLARQVAAEVLSSAESHQAPGSIERWHRTLKKFLAKRSAASPLALLCVIDHVVRH
jgi:hypothetical protein